MTLRPLDDGPVASAVLFVTEPSGPLRVATWPIAVDWLPVATARELLMLHTPPPIAVLCVPLTEARTRSTVTPGQKTAVLSGPAVRMSTQERVAPPPSARMGAMLEVRAWTPGLAAPPGRSTERLWFEPPPGPTGRGVLGAPMP